MSDDIITTVAVITAFISGVTVNRLWFYSRQLRDARAARKRASNYAERHERFMQLKRQIDADPFTPLPPRELPPRIQVGEGMWEQHLTHEDRDYLMLQYYQQVRARIAREQARWMN